MNVTVITFLCSDKAKMYSSSEELCQIEKKKLSVNLDSLHSQNAFKHYGQQDLVTEQSSLRFFDLAVTAASTHKKKFKVPLHPGHKKSKSMSTNNVLHTGDVVDRACTQDIPNPFLEM
jgi:hypothetical protein